MKEAKGNGLFDRSELCYAWHDRKLVGVMRWFCRELRFARQRVCRGYCDMDVWNLYDWFLDVVPDMLRQLRETGVGFPCSDAPNVSHSISPDACHRAAGENTTVSEEEHTAFEKGQAEWHAILDRMIYLFREADEDRCTRKNSHEAAYDAAYSEFEAKNGMFGEKLHKPEDEDGAGHRLYTLLDVEEYREIAEEYLDEAREIDRYRAQCKDEAFQLFAGWFYALWD